MKLGLSLGLSSGPSAFSPASIFGASDGAWYDVSDLSTLYQDTAKTTAVAVGDPVRVIADKRGDANSDLVAPSDAARGTLRQDARGKYYVECLSGQAYYSAAAHTLTLDTFIGVAITINASSSGSVLFGLHQAANNSFYINNNNIFSVAGSLTRNGVGTNTATVANATVPRRLPTYAEARLTDLLVSASVNKGGNWTIASTVTTGFSVASMRYALNLQAGGVVSASTTPVNFYGGIIVHAIPSAGDRTSVADYFRAKMAIDEFDGRDYDVFVIAGQSNGMGVGDDVTSEVVGWGDAVEYLDGNLKQLADPTRHYAASSTTASADRSLDGSAWPSFAKEYYAQTGRRVCIVGAAANGAGVIAHWNPTASFRNHLASKLSAAVSHIQGLGGTATVQGVIFVGGEKDAVDGVTEANYEAGLATLLSNFRTVTGIPTLKLFLTSPDQNTDPAKDANFAAIRQATIDYAAAEADAYLVMPYQEFEVNGMLEDTVHFNQTALNSMGVIVATNIVTELGL